MSDPQLRIRTAQPFSEHHAPAAFHDLEITQHCGVPLPFEFTKITLTAGIGCLLTMDIHASGRFALDVEAGLRHIEINGRTFQLVEVDPDEVMR
jgi:hypothetical protein